MKLWKKENNDIFDINYADLVSDTEECINKVWNFVILRGNIVKAVDKNTLPRQPVSIKSLKKFTLLL